MDTSKIDSLTYAELRNIAALFTDSKPSCSPVLGKPHPYELGKHYLIRTVTMIDTGRVVTVTETEIILEDAAWVADTGRFSAALNTSEFNEVEPFPDGQVIVNRAAVIDAVQIKPFKRATK